MTTNYNYDFQSKTFQLHPIDRERLNLTGELPDLDLLRSAPEMSDDRCGSLTGSPSTGVDPFKVHTIETSPGKSPDRSYHGHSLKDRLPAYLRALELYSKIDGSFAGKNVIRLRTCRKFAHFMRNEETGMLKIRSSRCKLRWCPICRDVSRRIVTAAVDDWLKHVKFPKMLTFTLKHSDDELEFQVGRLYECFKKIRQRKYVKDVIDGGVWFFQLKLNLKTDQWHPHLHCLVGGKFISHSKIKDLWQKITGDSFVVDVRPVRDVESVSTEVARYATAPADITRMTVKQSVDVYWATKSRKICGTWGNAKGMILRPSADDETADWSKVAEFEYINSRREFDSTAAEFWRCFIKKIPYNGPKVQPDEEVFREELNILFERGDPPDNFKDFNHRLSKNRRFDSMFYINSLIS